MSEKKGILIKELIDEYKMKIIYMPHNAENMKIFVPLVDKVSLCLVGFFDCFEYDSIYILSKSEINFLKSLGKYQRLYALDIFFCHKPPLVVIASGLEILDEIISCAKKYFVACTWTEIQTSTFIRDVTKFLEFKLASIISMHGELVIIYGEGVVITGKSGVGKSETAIELIRRGHCLVADDVVEIRKTSDEVLIGTVPDNIRYFVELRGVGIVNVKKMFGIDSVKTFSQIDLIVELVDWEKQDSLRLVNENCLYENILGIDVPIIKIPVKHGRNMSTLIETAAMANKQRKIGYNAVEDLFTKLGYTKK